MKVKVLMTGADNSPGGVLGYINSLVEHGDRVRFEFHITVSTGVENGNRFFHPAMTPHFFPRSYGVFSLIGQVVRLRGILTRNGIQVFHMHTLRAGFLGVIASMGLPVTRIYTGHSWRYLQKGGALSKTLFYFLEKFTCRRADTVTFLTELDREWGIRKKLVAAERGRHIRTRVERLDRGRYSSEELSAIRSRLGLPAEAVVVGTTALVSPRKDPFTFVRIAARVASAIPGVYFLWVGDGVMKEEARQLAKELGVEDRLIFTGMLAPEQVEAVLLVMDVFLFTSLIEGVPLSVLAAQACGLPIVCSRYEGSGVEELVQDGQTGLLFTPGDDATAAAHIVTLIRNPAERDLLVGRMKKDFEMLHADPAIMAREFAMLYEAGARQS